MTYKHVAVLDREKGSALVSTLGGNSEFVEVNIDNTSMLEEAMRGTDALNPIVVCVSGCIHISLREHTYMIHLFFQLTLFLESLLFSCIFVVCLPLLLALLDALFGYISKLFMNARSCNKFYMPGNFKTNQFENFKIK